ncbi:MAG: GIY-YIG nuclease family protein [Cyclobacteriaceae bacterium]
MSACYILHSQSLNKYYVGSTQLNPQDRLLKHNTFFYGSNKYTAMASDWQIFTVIECRSIVQARSVEAHIKKMKSRKYIENLLTYPEMVERLLSKYNP